MDRKKVINELRFQLDSKEVKDQHYPVQLSASDANTILALLKEQEAVEPVRDEHDDFCCGRCGKRIAWAIKIFDGYGFVTTHPDHLKPESKCNFCKHCGQAVKWDG